MVPSTAWKALVFGERTLFGWLCSFPVSSKQIVADAIYQDKYIEDNFKDFIRI